MAARQGLMVRTAIGSDALILGVTAMAFGVSECYMLQDKIEREPLPSTQSVQSQIERYFPSLLHSYIRSDIFQTNRSQFGANRP